MLMDGMIVALGQSLTSQSISRHMEKVHETFKTGIARAEGIRAGTVRQGVLGVSPFELAETYEATITSMRTWAAASVQDWAQIVAEEGWAAGYQTEYGDHQGQFRR